MRWKRAWDVVTANDTHIIVDVTIESGADLQPPFNEPMFGMIQETYPGDSLRKRTDVVQVPLRVLREFLAAQEDAHD